MSKFMLFMRGNQEYFTKLSKQEQKQVIASHVEYSRFLADKKLLLDGDGFGFESKLIEKTQDQIRVNASPFTGPCGILFFLLLELGDLNRNRRSEPCIFILWANKKVAGFNRVTLS